MILAIMALLLPFPAFAAVYSWGCITGNPHKWRTFLALFVYTVFVFSYVINPVYENDLSRYFMMIDSIRGMNLHNAIHELNDGLLLENLLFWIVSKIGDNHLLPAVTTSTVYGISAYITLDYAESQGFLKNAWIVLFYEVAQYSFFSIANNVRNIFTFSLIVLAAYRDLYKKKRDIYTIFLYLAPCLMHKTGIVLLLIRMLVNVARKALIIVVAVIPLLPSVIVLVYENREIVPARGLVGRLLTRTIASSYNYLMRTSDYARYVQASKGQALIRLVMMIIILLVGMLSFIYNTHVKSDFNVFCFLLCAVVLACNAFTTPVYWRFAVAAAMSSPPAVFWLIQQRKLRMYLVRIVLLMLVAARFVLDIAFIKTRISYMDFLADALTTNIYTIGFNFIKCLLQV